MLGGLNAGLFAREQDAWCPRRDEAYLGVLVDDLITKGVSEPYRMFTSRAEFRLQLREDNADLRLTEMGRKLGVVGDEQWDAFCRKRDAVEAEKARLQATWLHPSKLADPDALARVLGKPIEREYTLQDLLKRPNVPYRELMTVPEAADGAPELADEVAEQVEIQVKYQGYINRQNEELARRDNLEDIRLPGDIDYGLVKGLSKEVQQKLNQQRPETLGQASRIQGITPAAVALLMVHLKRGFTDAKTA
ncbi:Glucose-inhibited division protein A [Chromobacterium violaceum]|uniref:Glucose-inhibited division protein A n=1 Tax=Chromobacterium violaceum TaxID=536 RepID=A0A3S4HMW7_CHRVL|nr:Glucose-inhibited division protein A [Chromobacterium violaceum]